MKCPKCKDGILEEDEFDESIGICDTCNAVFQEVGGGEYR